MGPDVLKSEVLHMIAISKPWKLIGPDEVFIELIKLTEEYKIDLIVRLLNKIYRG